MLGEHLGRAAEHADGGPQLVGGHGEELRLVVGRRLEPRVERLELGVRDRRSAPLRSLGASAARCVSRVTLANPRCSPSASKTAVITTLAQNARPVLADAPPLLLVVALAQRRSASSRSAVAGAATLRRVEDAEVLADDLVGRVALAALGAGVPARDAALGVEHEDRVVLDGLDQQPEPLLALAQHLLGLAALGDVPGDLGEAEELAVVVADRR